MRLKSRIVANVPPNNFLHTPADASITNGRLHKSARPNILVLLTGLLPKRIAKSRARLKVKCGWHFIPKNVRTSVFRSPIKFFKLFSSIKSESRTPDRGQQSRHPDQNSSPYIPHLGQFPPLDHASRSFFSGSYPHGKRRRREFAGGRLRKLGTLRGLNIISRHLLCICFVFCMKASNRLNVPPLATREFPYPAGKKNSSPVDNSNPATAQFLEKCNKDAMTFPEVI